MWSASQLRTSELTRKRRCVASRRMTDRRPAGVSGSNPTTSPPLSRLASRGGRPGSLAGPAVAVTTRGSRRDTR